MADFMSYIDAAADAGSDFVSNIDTTAATDAASNSNWWETGIEYANKAFNWMGENPEATNVIAGVAGGVGQYFSAQQQLKQQQDFEREMMDRRRDERRISPAGIPGYGSHVATAKGGLLTNGMIVPDEENK